MISFQMCLFCLHWLVATRVFSERLVWKRVSRNSALITIDLLFRDRTKKDETNQAIRKLLGKREIDKNAIINKKLLKAAKILERMVNQNTYNDIAQGELEKASVVQ